MDDQKAGGRGQQRPRHDPHNNHHNPRCANHWAPLTQQRHHEEHRPPRPSEHVDPTQHVERRTDDCPCPRPLKETAPRRNVTPGGGGEVDPPPPLRPLKAAAAVGVLPHRTQVLFDVGVGDEDPEVVPWLLDVEAHPRKPRYEPATEVGLVLWDCRFDGVEWSSTVRAQRRIMTRLLETYEERVVKVPHPSPPGPQSFRTRLSPI